MRPLLLCLLLVFTTAHILHADETSPARTSTAGALNAFSAPPEDTPTYRIAAQDVLDIAVQDHADLSKTAAVLPDGTISFPYIGEFKAAGLTLHEISARITSALSKEIVSPQVMVTIRTLHEQPTRQVSQVSILGAVRATGKHVLHEGWRVLDLIIEAGGLPTEHPSDFSASIIRSGTEIIPVDLSKILTATDVKANLLLAPNDILVVRETVTVTPQIQILGEVVRPGTFPLPKDGSIVTLLSAAGGPTSKAALSKATLTHNGQTSAVNLNSFLAEGKVSENVKMEAGDTLFLPPNKLTYSVYGAVAHPGLQVYPDSQEISVWTALSLAGGQTTDANLKEVSVIHPSKNGKPDTNPVNLEDVLRKGDLSKDIALRPGDILFVPARTHKGGFNFSSFLYALPYLGILGRR